jgi:hypothetical protein
MLMAEEAVVNYAGQIHGRARFDIPDQRRTNIAFEPARVRLHNARNGVAPSLEREGFALITHRSAVCHSKDMAELDRVYHAELAALIGDITGADLVLPQRTGLLLRRGERAKEPTWARPARFAHLDYTAKSVGDFVGWLEDWEGAKLRGYPRVAIYQTWRAISPPPQDSTLALCDARTLTPDDFVVFDAVIGDTGAPGEVFESRLCRFKPAHRWLYYPDLRDDELMVFKAYDSDPAKPSDVPHTSVENPAAGPGAAPRESLEARFFAFFVR